MASTLTSTNQEQLNQRLYAKRRAAIVQMHENGESVRQIADLYKCTTQNVYRILGNEKRRKAKLQVH